ncbi:MAG: ATP-dependent DNA helicase RecG [Gammaproteobacteria bacterium]|nr:ATP-dependent DNA helicase RecG [Gammaproteobacteria bacterium]MBU1408718.1 ATP-dependent DNA helicase RecG [Gammaproteobacteria bacterium]MBU1533520.1 ATP-dependent DNA helicase RecG [Gammaproteobacteria bacterium]
MKAASPFSFPVSPALAAKLAKLGLARDADLVLHLPLRWEDETRLTPIRDLLPGATAQVQAVVRDAKVAYRPRRMLTVTVEDGGGVLGIRFLNFYPSHLKLFQPGESFRFNGEVRGGFLGLEMVHPRFAKADDATPLPTQLTPVYPTTAGLGQASLRKLVERALAAPIADTLPADWLTKLGLPELEASIRLLHQPPLECALAELESRRHPAWQRLAFDELLAQQLSLATARQQRKSRPTRPLPPRQQLTHAFTAALPFALTAAQARAWQEISADLAQPHPMRRLLQGDVGSGKTVVAALACLQAIENGFQAAFMAPTEILAEQHYRKLAPALSKLDVRCAWVSGGQRKAERSAAWQAIAAGEADLAFGTHALFQEAGAFAKLGVAVVDEQHRFGVGQRLALMQKGTEPHQLMMSATPIPRTLAMSFFADLDVSVIDELPPGRTPIVTKLVSAARRDDVLARVTDACLAGGQAYWVCPLIEESEKLQLQTAQDTYAALTEQLPDLKIGLVHGRLKPDEKQAVMAAFQAHEIDLLVATTVIEVGVDVPNAALMVIEHAERMGLAQLHQLRGRVGRGSRESVCVLLYETPLSELARARLKVIFELTDGFEIARQDLLLRGPGELLGHRQSGLPMLRFADLERDVQLLEAARDLARRCLARHPDIAARHMERWIGQRQALTSI